MTLVALVALVSALMVVLYVAKVIRRHRQVRVVLATAWEGGEYEKFGETLKKVINRNQRRIRIETRITSGSVQNMRLLEENGVHLATVQSDTPASPSIRAVAALFPELFHLIVLKNSGIRGIRDLRGKRIAVMPNLLGEEGSAGGFFDQYVERYNLRRSDFEAVERLKLAEVSAQFDEKNDDEKLDAIFLAIAVGNTCVGDLLKTRPVELAPIDVHAIEAWHPYVQEATIHKGAYWGDPAIPEEDVPSASVGAMLLTHEGVDRSVVYEITRILIEHRNELLRENPHAFTIRYPESGENLGIPLHTGAKAYYAKGRPGFLVTYAEVLALLLSTAVLCATGIWHLRLRLQQRQKNRADMYNLEIFRLVERVRATEDLHELAEVRQQLFNIFRRVLEDLDRDRISPESFQLFAFPCEVAITAMRHRELVLMSLLPGREPARDQSAKEPEA